MTANAYGPLWRVDGPLPLAPRYGLLQAMEAAAPEVRLLTDVDGVGIERWMNGIEVFPYPPDAAAGVFDACAPGGSTSHSKGFGSAVNHPQFAAFVVHIDETCTSHRVWSQEAFRARAVAALAAVEGAGVAGEFLGGAGMPANPHLSDASVNCAFPNGDALTSPLNGLAILEKYIATTSGRRGVIHLSPQVATVLRAHFVIDERDGVLRTAFGTLCVPDAGYAAGANPIGHAAATGTNDWIYASGPVDVRRSEVFTTPTDVSEALDRGSGATAGNVNAITYRAERYYAVNWDTHVQAAVRVNRCLETCT